MNEFPSVSKTWYRRGGVGKCHDSGTYKIRNTNNLWNMFRDCFKSQNQNPQKIPLLSNEHLELPMGSHGNWNYQLTALQLQWIDKHLTFLEFSPWTYLQMRIKFSLKMYPFLFLYYHFCWMELFLILCGLSDPFSQQGFGMILNRCGVLLC